MSKELKKEVKNIKVRHESIVDETIRHLKIKEQKENKENIQNKIKTLEANMRLLENNNFTRLKTEVDENVIEQNIKKHQVKEVRNKREALEMKVKDIELHIKKLMDCEPELNLSKKIQVRHFVDSKERDKSLEKDKYKKWENEREERISHFTEIQRKNEEKAKEELQRQREELENKKREDHKIHFEKLLAKNSEIKEKVKAEDAFKNNKIEHKQYVYEKIEEEYRLKQQKLEDEKNKSEAMERLKRKKILCPIRKEDLDEFQRSYLEKKNEILMQKDKERILKTEEIENLNSKILKTRPENELYKKIVMEDKILKEAAEKQKVDRIYKKMKIKNFSKVIKDNLLPKIDEEKKKELEDMINKSKNPSNQHYKRKKVYNVVLKKKPTISNNASNRPLSSINTNDVQNSVMPASSASRSPEISRPTSGGNIKSKPVEIRKPLEKNPNYLIELRLRKNRKNDDGYEHNLTAGDMPISTSLINK